MATGESDGCQVNKALLPIKVFYFFSLAAVSALPPYLSYYMFAIGLSKGEIAIIYGLLPFVAFFVRPIFGLLADHYHKHKLILLLSCVLMGLSHMLFLLAPLIDGHPSVLMNCRGEQVEIHNDSLPMMNSLLEDLRANNGRQCQLDCKFSKSVQFCTIDSSATVVCQPNISTGSFTYNLSAVANLGHKEKNTGIESVGDNQGFDNHSTSLMNMNYNFTNATYIHTVQYPRHLPAPIIHNNTNYVLLTCDMSESPIECQVKCLEENRYGHQFWFMLVISFVTQMFINPVLSMSDGIAYAILGNEHEKWGNQRLWGTVGQIIAAISAGLLMDSYGIGSVTSVNFDLIFYLFAGLSVMTTVSAYFLQIPKDMHCHQVMKSMGELLKMADVLVLLSLSFFMGSFLGINMVYVFIFMEELNAPKYLMGIILAEAHIVELPMLFFAGHVITRIGHISCFHIGTLAYAIKLFAYGFITNPFWLILVEPLHACAFALFYASASALASKISPVELSATMQGLLGGVYFGLAMGVGSLTGGFIYQSYDAYTMWRIFGITGFVLFVVYAVIYHAIMRKPFIQRVAGPSVEQTGESSEPLEVESLNPANDAVETPSGADEKHLENSC